MSTEQFQSHLSRLLRLVRLALNPHDPPRIPPASLWVIRQARVALDEQMQTATEALIKLGNIEYGLQEYARATRYFTQAAVQALNEQKDAPALTALMNLGATYKAVHDHERGIAAFGRAIEVAERLADHEQRVQAMIAQANGLKQLRRSKESHRLLTDAIVEARKYKLVDAESRCWLAFSHFDYAEGRFEAAIEKLRKSLDLSALSGNLVEQVRGYFNIGLVYADAGDFDSSIRSLTRAREICQTNNITYDNRIDKALTDITARSQKSLQSGAQDS